MKLNYLKEYIKRRIEHAESRFNSLKERHGDNTMVSHTYGDGQSLGYWQGMISAYDNILDIIESSDDENNKYDEEEKFTEYGLKYCSCGGEPKIEQSDYYRSGYDGWYVYCRKCGKQVVCENHSGAISLWNNKHAKE